MLAALAMAALPQWAVFDEARLTADNPMNGEVMGASLAFEGDTLVAGAPARTFSGTVSGRGSAYVFVRDATAGWIQDARLVAPDGKMGDDFGDAVALSGNRVLVGARFHGVQAVPEGAAYFFEHDGSSWVHTQKLTDVNATLLGYSVALEGDCAVVGTAQGEALVYEHDGTQWAETARLHATSFNRYAVALDVDTIVVGDEDAKISGSRTGAAHVFVRAGSTWVEQAQLTASDGADIDYFGHAVDVNGDLVLVGAYGVDSNFSNTGAAYVFRRTGTTWVEEAKLTGVSQSDDMRFGSSVNLQGTVAIVGAPAAHGLFSGFDQGGAYVYRYKASSSSWLFKAWLQVPGGAPSLHDRYGESVVLSGPGGAVGKAEHDAPGFLNIGEAHVFWLGKGNPAGTTYCTAGTSSLGCQSLITSYGSPSASAPSGFTLVAQGGKSSSGIFFFGTNGRQAIPWGNGTSYQCVVPPVTRTGLLTPGSPGCGAVYLRDLNARWCASCPKPWHNPGPGAVVQAQLWYRDNGNTHNKTTSMSDALEFTVGP